MIRALATICIFLFSAISNAGGGYSVDRRTPEQKAAEEAEFKKKEAFIAKQCEDFDPGPLLGLLKKAVDCKFESVSDEKREGTPAMETVFSATCKLPPGATLKNMQVPFYSIYRETYLGKERVNKFGNGATTKAQQLEILKTLPPQVVRDAVAESYKTMKTNCKDKHRYIDANSSANSKVEASK